MEGEGPQAELSGPEKRRRNGKASDMTEEKRKNKRSIVSNCEEAHEGSCQYHYMHCIITYTFQFSL